MDLLIEFFFRAGMGKFIVSVKWLKESKLKGSWAEEVGFIINDHQAEKKYRFSLEKSIFSSQKWKLLSNFKFLLTESIKPTPAEFKQIIESSGGKVRLFFI